MLKQILKYLLGGAFLFSAYTKFVEPGLVEVILVDQGIIPERITAGYIVRGFIALEFAIGIMFLLGYNLRKFVIPLSLALLVFFTGYLVYSGFILGDKENCGCFGSVLKMSPLESIIKNIILAGMVAWLFFLLKEEKKKWKFVAGVLVFSFAFVIAAMPVKDVKDFQFARYTHFEGKGRVDLADGEKLIGVFSLECEHCQLAARDIWRLKERFKFVPEIYALYFAEGNVSVDSFKTLTGSNFPYYLIDVEAFFSLIGNSPPRIYWLENGKVREYWDEGFLKNITINFSNRK